MKYIIADPDIKNALELKKILDGYEMLDFQGTFTILEAAGERILGEPPDIVFIRMGKSELNAFGLVRRIREQNEYLKVILFGSCKEDAVEAFEIGAEGFLLIPFNKKKIDQWLKQNIVNTNCNQMEQGEGCRNKKR